MVVAMAPHEEQYFHFSHLLFVWNAGLIIFIWVCWLLIIIIIIIHSGYKMSVNSEKWRLVTEQQKIQFTEATQTLLIYIRSTNQFIISALPVINLITFLRAKGKKTKHDSICIKIRCFDYSLNINTWTDV